MEYPAASSFRPFRPQLRPLVRITQQSGNREYALFGALTFITEYEKHWLFADRPIATLPKSSANSPEFTTRGPRTLPGKHRTNFVK
jgi:hypothetical protein